MGLSEKGTRPCSFLCEPSAVPEVMCFVYASLGLVLCYGRPPLVWAVSQFTSWWHSRLLNTGVDSTAASTPPQSQGQGPRNEVVVMQMRKINREKDYWPKYTDHPCPATRKLKQATKAMATRTSPNKRFNEKNNSWTTRIWNLLITRLDLDNVTFENFKSVLYGYYSRALAINYDPDSPRSFKSICLKCNTARFLDQELSCCTWFSLLLLYLFIFWVRSNWL